MKHSIDPLAGSPAPATSRRSFLGRMGAGVSAAAAAVVATANPRTPANDEPAQRAAMLEEQLALQRLHRNFEEAMDAGRHDTVMALFTEDAEVLFNGGLFRGRAGVGRLFGAYLPARKAGVRMAPAPGYELPAAQRQEIVEVAADRATATAVFPYSIQVGEPLESGNSLASMARLHGEGVRTWWEGGHYRVTYRRDAAAGGRWLIARLEYDTRARADYRPGRSYAEPIVVAPFRTRFPQDGQGPDALV